MIENERRNCIEKISFESRQEDPSGTEGLILFGSIFHMLGLLALICSNTIYFSSLR